MRLPSLVSKVQAAGVLDFTQPLFKAIGWDNAGERSGSIAAFVQPFLNVLYGIAAVILLINIVVAGIKISVHEKKGLEEAKKNLRYSIIGLSIVMLATIITNLLMALFVW